MRNYLMSVVCLVAVCASTGAMAQWWNPLGPNNYDECVLQNMQGVTNDNAALAISSACRRQFPSASTAAGCQAYREFSFAERQMISATASISNNFEPYFSARIYNGSGLEIHKVAVLITTPEAGRQTYELYVSNPIRPNQTDNAGASILRIPLDRSKLNLSLSSVQTCAR